jgi:hypothetical protein
MMRTSVQVYDEVEPVSTSSRKWPWRPERIYLELKGELGRRDSRAQQYLPITSLVHGSHMLVGVNLMVERRDKLGREN